MAGLNATVTDAEFVHGTNPQSLVEKITRLKIYESAYWKQHCFGLNEETLLEKAVELSYIGGVYGPLSKPTKFLCLVLKMLQLQPDLEVVKEYITQPDFKYLTALGLFYLRFVGKSVDVYSILESCLSDYRKLRVRKLHGWQIMPIDEFVDDLLQETLVLDLALPHLPMRKSLVHQMRLRPYVSSIQEEFDSLKDEDSSGVDAERKRARGVDDEDNEGQQRSNADHAAGEGPPVKKTKGKHAVFDKLFGKKTVESRDGDGASRSTPGYSARRAEKEGLDDKGEEEEDIEENGKGRGVEKGSDDRGREKEKEKEKEGSVRWWNKRRKMLGLKPLNVPEE